MIEAHKAAGIIISTWNIVNARPTFCRMFLHRHPAPLLFPWKSWSVCPAPRFTIVPCSNHVFALWPAVLPPGSLSGPTWDTPFLSPKPSATLLYITDFYWQWKCTGRGKVVIAARKSGIALFPEIFGLPLAMPLLKVRLPACDQVPLSPSPFLSFPCPLSSSQNCPQNTNSSHFVIHRETSPLPFWEHICMFPFHIQSHVRVLP